MSRTGLQLKAKAPLDRPDPLRLSLIDAADFRTGPLDRGEVVGRDAALRLQCRGREAVDIADCLGRGPAGCDCCGERFLRSNPALALARAGGASEAFRLRRCAVETRLAGTSLGNESGQA